MEFLNLTIYIPAAENSFGGNVQFVVMNGEQPQITEQLITLDV